MAWDEDDRFPASGPAREARRLLSEALRELQTAQLPSSLTGPAVECAAGASSALYEVENQARSQQQSNAGVKLAIENLGQALSALRAHGGGEPALDRATETIARTLALLYPVARSQQRRRKEAMMIDSSLVEIPATSPDPALPAAPAPLGRPRVSTPPYQGQEHRTRGTRVFVEVDIGLASESHFYAGLSQDLSTGGVFIATYDSQPPGTVIALYFALPNGYVVQANGVVRWTRGASDDSPPGMGVSFTELSEEDVRQIAGFCEQRAPLYHDSGDEPAT